MCLSYCGKQSVFSVYANTADRYGVVDPKGTIAPHSYIDLLVRHNAPFPSNCHNKDRFMITMQDATTNQVSRVVNPGIG